MSSSDSSCEEYNRRYRSPSPFEEKRRPRKYSPERNRSQRRGSHEDHKKKHHKGYNSAGPSTSKGKSHDRGRDEERDRGRDHYRRDDYKKEPKSSRASSPGKSFSSDMSFLERSTVLKPKKEGDVIESMENGFTEGPLDVLKRCVHDGQKVMVWVRSMKGIRGICTGFVLAFDKYWNLVMQDVDEVYQKNINPRTPFLLPERVGHQLPEKSKKKKKTEDPKLEPEFVLSDEVRQELRELRNKRKEEEKRQRIAQRTAVCKRNMPKAFVRGDNVIFVKICE